MSKATRVLIITSVYPRWDGDSTPAFVQNIAQDLAASDFEVRVLAPHDKGCPLETVEKGVSVRRHRYAFPTSLQELCYEGGMIVRLREKAWRNALLPSFAISQFIAIKQEIKRFCPHIIHTHSLLPQGWITAKALGKKTQVPYIVSSHGNDVFGLQGRFTQWKEQTAERATALVANSQATGNALAQFANREKIETIHASPNQSPSPQQAEIDSVRARLGGHNKKLMVFAGRLIPEKGIDLLIDILPDILKKTPDAKLVICGSGPLAGFVRSHVQNFPNPEAIEYLGWIPNEQVPTYLTAADIVVVPSQPQASGWSEAQGLVAVEAMAAEKTVIASRLGGLAESLVDRESGFLVDPLDRPAWVQAIAHALSAGPEQRLIWGQAARQRYLQHYSREANLKKTIALYRRFRPEGQC